MAGNRSTGTSLFDLLARAWNLDSEIVQTGFNHADTAMFFRLRSGQIALASTSDAESPKARTRIEVDTGRTTIRQRENPVPEAKLLPLALKPGLPAVRFGPQGFMVIDTQGIPHHITAQGQCIAKTTPGENFTITSLCSDPTGEILAMAKPCCISLHQAMSMSVLSEIAVARRIDCMAFSDTGDTLAAWGEDCLTLTQINNPAAPARTMEGISNITQINWDSSGNYLACSSSTNAFWIIDIHSGMSQKVQDFPDQVNTAMFSKTGKALVTSGAYRLAGWSTDDLPHDNQPGTPLATGKSGLVVINTIAAHPTRALIAAGYANGLVTITSIGTTQEMMVHKEQATEVSSLSWSTQGEHLTIGFRSGKAAVVTFPDKLFK